MFLQFTIVFSPLVPKLCALAVHCVQFAMSNYAKITLELISRFWKCFDSRICVGFAKVLIQGFVLVLRRFWFKDLCWFCEGFRSRFCVSFAEILIQNFVPMLWKYWVFYIWCSFLHFLFAKFKFFCFKDFSIYLSFLCFDFVQFDNFLQSFMMRPLQFVLLVHFIQILL